MSNNFHPVLFGTQPEESQKTATPNTQQAASKAYIHGVRWLESKHAPVCGKMGGPDQPYIEVSSEIAKDIKSLCDMCLPDLKHLVVSGLSLDTTDMSVLRQKIPFDLEQPLAITCEFDSWSPVEERTPFELKVDLATIRLWWVILYQFKGDMPRWLIELNTHLSIQSSIVGADQKSHVLEPSQLQEIQQSFRETLGMIELNDDYPISYFLYHIVHTALQNTFEPPQKHSPALQDQLPAKPLRALFINAAMMRQIMSALDHGFLDGIVSTALRDFLQSNMFQMCQSFGIWLRDDSWPHSIALRSVLCNGLETSDLWTSD